MITKSEFKHACDFTINILKKNNIAITPDEEKLIEVADFGLSNLKQEGLQILTYLNTERCCSKELILYPNQTCPEHRHPMVNKQLGKEETFRCRVGEVYLYVEGEVTKNIKAIIPSDQYTVFHEIILKQGQQYTLPPNTLHWFQSGDKGAVVSEFSTSSYDEYDIFTDPEIKRSTIVE